MLLMIKFGNYDTTIRDEGEDALGIRKFGDGSLGMGVKEWNGR